MDYKVAVKSDVGITKSANQDSCCYKEAVTDDGKVILAVICDGMGGLSKGEVASASVINAFSQWFEKELPKIIGKTDVSGEILYQMDRLIKKLNNDIAQYGIENGISLGTTVSAFIVLENGEYIISHVGDSRIYVIKKDSMRMLTNDQTLVANEVAKGNITAEEAGARLDRNILLQCVGASKVVTPEFYKGKICKEECYLLCSDGFCHEITVQEMWSELRPGVNEDENKMRKNIEKLIGMCKERDESDNITAMLIETC